METGEKREDDGDEMRREERKEERKGYRRR